VQGLRALGYVEGQNLILERRSAEGRFERFREIISELVRVKADAIEAPGDLIPRAAMAITTTVPIVMTTSTDPVREGLVQSLALPGGNITGLALTPGPETEAKRLELLREHGEPRPHRIELAALRADSSYGAFDGSGRTRSLHSRRARIGKVASPPAECLADARLTAVLSLITLSAFTGDQGTS
jgi:hypothetical protein